MGKQLLISSMVVSCLLLAACPQEEAPEAPTEPATDTTAPTETPTPAKAPAEAPTPEKAPEKVVEREPGALPFDFPRSESTTAKAGDYVLCPPIQAIDRAFAGESTNLIYYTSKMVAPGQWQSKVKTLAGTESTIPNALIIPIRTGEKASPGDIVLTWWQSGSGMQRSIVQPGGSPEEPVVLHLDLDYDNPAGVGKAPDTLRPNSFHLLRNEWDIGTAVACKSGTRYTHGILSAEAESKVLVRGFVNKMTVHDKATCVPIPMRPSVKAGQKVFAEGFGRMVEMTVTKVDTKIGRVFADLPIGSTSKARFLAFGDVIAALP